MATTVEYLHLCDYAFSDAMGRQCFIGIFDQLVAADFPANSSFFIVLKAREAANQLAALEIRVDNPAGARFLTASAPLSLGNDGAGTVRVSGFVQLQSPGNITYRSGKAGNV